MRDRAERTAQRKCCSRVVVHPILSFWVSLFYFFHIVHMKHEHDVFCPTFVLILLFIFLVPLCTAVLCQLLLFVSLSFSFSSDEIRARACERARFTIVNGCIFCNSLKRILQQTSDDNDAQELKNENKCSGFFKVIMTTE